MTNIDFEQNDLVVTSRGIYGTVVSTDSVKDTSKLFIGSKLIDIPNNQLKKVNDKPYVICYCTDGYTTFNHRVTLPKQFELFDFNNPLANKLLDYCKATIAKTNTNFFNILKIEF